MPSTQEDRSLSARLESIKKIEEMRKSKVICYLTGDRPTFETRIHSEVQSRIFDHLSKIGTQDRVDLFLYSRGGETIASLGIVNIIREFSKEFNVIIPYRAHSTATLIAIGADAIIMGKLGQLGPVDPSVNTPFNPAQQIGNQKKVLPISVEEVAGFFSLAKDENLGNIKLESGLIDVFKQLSSQVHPLALGSVYRAKAQIKMLAHKLLSFHFKDNNSDLDQIINLLTKELYSHDYIICRQEAKRELKLNVVNAEEISNEFNAEIYKLYKLYEASMELIEGFSPEVFIGTSTEKTGTFRRAYLESIPRTDCFVTKKLIKRTQQTQQGIPIPIIGYVEQIIEEGWKINERP